MENSNQILSMQPGIQVNIINTSLFSWTWYSILKNYIFKQELMMLPSVTFNIFWKNSVILGSKLYFMNKDGGLSVFDVKSKITKEILDNTTFVSIKKIITCHSIHIIWFFFKNTYTQIFFLFLRGNKIFFYRIKKFIKRSN